MSPECWCEQPLLAEPLLPLPTPAAQAPLEEGQQLFCPACAFSSEAGWRLAAEMLLAECLAALQQGNMAGAGERWPLASFPEAWRR